MKILSRLHYSVNWQDQGDTDLIYVTWIYLGSFALYDSVKTGSFPDLLWILRLRTDWVPVSRFGRSFQQLTVRLQHSADSCLIPQFGFVRMPHENWWEMERQYKIIRIDFFTCKMLVQLSGENNIYFKLIYVSIDWILRGEISRNQMTNGHHWWNVLDCLAL